MTHCVLCGHDAFVPVHSLGRTGPLLTVACERCGMVQHAERPSADEVARYYASGDYRREFPTLPTAGCKPGQPGYQAARDAEGDSIAGHIVARTQAQVYYEVGAGDCSVTRALRRLGRTAYALEEDPTIAGDELTLSALPDAFPPSSCVVALQVLEHLHDPVATLHDWLRAGVAYVEVPTIDRPYGSLTHFFQKPHLQSFSRETLAVCGLMAGAERVDLEILGTVLAATFRGRAERRTFDEVRAWVEAEPGASVAARLHRWEAARRGA